MNEEMIVVDDSKMFVNWTREHVRQPQIKEKQAKILLEAFENHHTELLIADNHTLHFKEEGGEVIGITLDDAIDVACEWNYEDIRECKSAMENASGFVEYCKYDNLLKELQKQEKVLDKMFEQTIYGAAISERMKELAEMTWKKTNLIPVYELPQLEDNVLYRNADKKEDFEPVKDENPFAETIPAVSEKTHTYEEKGRVM